MATPHVREVAKSLIGILQMNPHFLDLMEQEHEVRNGLDILDTVGSEGVHRRLVPNLLDFRIQLADTPPFPGDFLQNCPNSGKEARRFFKGKEPFFHFYHASVFQPPLRFKRRHAARPGCGDRLAENGILDIAAGKNAGILVRVELAWVLM